MLNKALEPIFSVTPALQKYVCKEGKPKSNFPDMNKQGPFTHPKTGGKGGGGVATA